jgi:tetratricopeptide (TPR) repeat protein
LQVIELDERNEQAWLWLSGVVESVEDRRTCLENVLAINPNNANARLGLERLESTPTTAAAPAPAPPPAPPAAVQGRCPHCNAGVPASGAACPSCGLPLIVACPSCGDYEDVEHNSCARCGHRLGDHRQGARYFADLAQAYLDRGKLDRAQEAMVYAEAQAPNDPQVLAGVAAVHKRAGRVDLAAAAYERAIAQDPHNAALHTNLGNAYQQLGQPEAAAELYERAAQMAGDDPARLCEAARLHLHEGGSSEAAMALLNRVIEKQPMYAQAHLLMGDAHVAEGRFEQAAAHFQNVDKLTSSDSTLGAEARRKLADLLSVLQPEIQSKIRKRSGAPGRRPGCITVYAGLTGFSAVMSVLGALAFAFMFNASSDMFEEAMAMQGTPMLFDVELIKQLMWAYLCFALVGAAINLTIAVGLWMMKNWARIVVIVLQGLGVLGALAYSVVTMLSARQVTGPGAGTFQVILIITLLFSFAVQGYIIFWFVANRELFN